MIYLYRGLTLLTLLLPGLQEKPINATCPVKGAKYAAKADLSVTYEGQVIGFC